MVNNHYRELYRKIEASDDTKELFFNLVVQLLTLNRIYHSAHHNMRGNTFFSDHEILNDFYEELEEDFDTSAEQYVGLYSDYDVNQLLELVVNKVKSYNAGIDFNKFVEIEKDLNDIVNILIKTSDYAEGTKNLIADFGTKSQKRLYKLSRRVIS